MSSENEHQVPPSVTDNECAAVDKADTHDSSTTQYVFNSHVERARGIEMEEAYKDQPDVEVIWSGGVAIAWRCGDVKM